jgi:hypothetical protein
MITGTYSTFLDYRLTKIQGLLNVKWILWETKQQPLYIYIYLKKQKPFWQKKTYSEYFTVIRGHVT